MIKIICDRCGKQLEEYNAYKTIIEPLINCDNDEDFNGHLCKKCYNAFFDFLELGAVEND